MGLAVELCGLKLTNPVIPASGTFGFAQEVARYYDLSILGSISLKGTTLSERYGNPTPRIAETPSGLLNAVGLQNPGVDAVIKNDLAMLPRVYQKPVIANVSGFSIDEYVQTAAKLAEQEQVGLIELNISCPNVQDGGMSFGTSPEAAAEVTRAVRAAVKKPLFVKLTPNVTDIVSIADAVANAGADGISLINTLLGLRVDLARRRPLLANGTGGLSGPAILPVALRMVYDVHRAVGLPIMGMGGVSCARDVIEMMLCGATAVQVGAANLKNPYACKEIIEALPREMERLGIKNLNEIIGEATRWDET